MILTFFSCFSNLFYTLMMLQQNKNSTFPGHNFLVDLKNLITASSAMVKLEIEFWGSEKQRIVLTKNFRPHWQKENGNKKPHIAHNLFYLIQAARFQLIIFFHLLKKDHFCWFCDILKKVPETRVPNTIPSKPPPLWWKVEQTGQTGVNFNWGWLHCPLCLISLHI